MHACMRMHACARARANRSLVYIHHNKAVRGAIASGQIDLYVVPPLSAKLLDYHLFDSIVTTGTARPEQGLACMHAHAGQGIKAVKK